MKDNELHKESVLKPLITQSSFVYDKSNKIARVKPSEVRLEIKNPVDQIALEEAKSIIDSLCPNPSFSVCPSKLLDIAKRFGDISDDSTTYFISSDICKAAFHGLSNVERGTLVNIYTRVKAFAIAQKGSLKDIEIEIPGGKAGHTVSPCQVAGCYAPGGRYPLPSSVIMTAVTARTAGCKTVVISSPHPAPITLAAAYLSGVDYFLSIGGAQSIAAMAYGIKDNNGDVLVPRCDIIVGPGNKWVTAAKSIVQGYCGIDMLAGPSEVLVICDKFANYQIVAADLVAQLEHDILSRAILLTDDQAFIDEVESALFQRLECLPEPNKSTVIAALNQSFAVHCDNLEECIKISDDIAPEHLEIQTRNAVEVGSKCSNYGGLFIGEYSAEVLGDYGAGPNHTLPTGGTGRYTGGLSVFNFLRIRTWIRIDDKEMCQNMVEDSVIMARLEGLEGHAKAAEARRLLHSSGYRMSN